MLAYRLAQSPVFVFSKGAAYVLLYAYFQRLTHLTAAYSDTNILLFRYCISDTVDSMFSILSSFALRFLHFHNTII